MKFNTAWAKVAKENVSLKYSLVCVSCISILLGIGLLQVSMKTPILIDRSCETQTISGANLEPTVSEIKEFSEKALLQRYSSEVKADSSFLSNVEISRKQSEEKTFKEKKVLQLAIVRKVLVNAETNVITAQLDRVFSMGKTRPAYPTELILDIQSTQRTSKNPYGLILNKIEVIKKEKKKEDS